MAYCPNLFQVVAVQVLTSAINRVPAFGEVGVKEVFNGAIAYTPDGSREFLEDKPFLEPFSLIPYLAACTERIRFTTSVVKLPLRHPVLAAKQVATIDRLCDGRFVFGVGIGGEFPAEFAACEVPDMA